MASRPSTSSGNQSLPLKAKWWDEQLARIGRSIDRIPVITNVSADSFAKVDECTFAPTTKRRLPKLTPHRFGGRCRSRKKRIELDAAKASSCESPTDRALTRDRENGLRSMASLIEEDLESSSSVASSGAAPVDFDRQIERNSDHQLLAIGRLIGLDNEPPTSDSDTTYKSMGTCEECEVVPSSLSNCQSEAVTYLSLLGERRLAKRRSTNTHHRHYPSRFHFTS